MNSGEYCWHSEYINLKLLYSLIKIHWKNVFFENSDSKNLPYCSPPCTHQLGWCQHVNNPVLKGASYNDGKFLGTYLYLLCSTGGFLANTWCAFGTSLNSLVVCESDLCVNGALSTFVFQNFNRQKQCFVKDPGFQVVWGILRRPWLDWRWTSQRETFNCKNWWKWAKDRFLVRPEWSGKNWIWPTIVFDRILISELRMRKIWTKMVPETISQHQTLPHINELLASKNMPAAPQLRGVYSI